ncbi:MAG: NADP-dependent isocitrate dehydrogenase [Planctomycetota bacterium]|nr:NADP-dependent isocitrate dehydrogenase [Planctomycetota bacterium]
MSSSKITWTLVDEAPALATYSLLPVLHAFSGGVGLAIETVDISLAGRILANFPEGLSEAQRIPDELSRLGEMVKTPSANIIKLPNISASVPQLQAAIEELRSQGFDVPVYPEEPSNDQERGIQERYATVLGSAVNPVLREGNSDRRPAAAVKRFAQEQPHRMMKDWPESGSQTRVAHMADGDFYGSEKSATLTKATTARIEFVGEGGEKEVWKETLPLLDGEVVDASTMSVSSLRAFYAEQIKQAKADGVLLSLHLKATMMKVSDPILFGHCVSIFFVDALEKHADALAEIGANVNFGLADVLNKMDRLPAEKKAEVEADIQACYESGPALAMVDSRNGITNLHVPNDVIIDASMPVVVRDGGRMWNKDDALQDTAAMIPDRCYATMYQAVIEDCQKHGQFDPSTMGNVSNVGLMAKKAEEYGSHDKTFVASTPGTVRVLGDHGEVLLEQKVQAGDLFRVCQTKDESIRDWVKLGVARAKATGDPTVFWLDENRGHDAQLIQKVNAYLLEHETKGLDIRILPCVEAMHFSLERVRRGENAIAVTGNVLRDYLTDLFPILELGTSARMLSIVPLLKGGGLFETGAGGSAPKHVQQFVKEGHLRWDSLGEYCALVPALEQAASSAKNQEIAVLAETLDEAVGQYLKNGQGPSRKVHELDNRGSTYFLTRYWAEALSAQNRSKTLQEKFIPVAKALVEQEEQILKELQDAQGRPMDLGGYYHPNPDLASAAMRPSKILNDILAFS